MIIILEGLIGAGKTTLGKMLENRGRFLNMPVIFLPEYTNQKFLELYLSNQLKYAFTFQSVILRGRLNTHFRAEALSKQGYLVIVDRGISGDLAFALMQKDRGYFDEEEWDAYLSILDEHKQTKLKPDLVLHLECDPQTAFDRLVKRGNQSEIDSYTIEYFKQLDLSHQKSFDLYKKLFEDVKIESIDWTKNIETMSEKNITNLENQIKNFLNNPVYQ